MAAEGGVSRIDLPRMRVMHFSLSHLQLQEPVAGITLLKDELALLTQTHLSVCDSAGRIIKKITYPFKSIRTFNDTGNIYSPAVRTNGDWIIMDAAGIKIWNPTTGFFKLL